MIEQTIPNEKTALRVMQVLQTQPELSQRELAKQVGVSLGALNYCVKALVSKGFVKLENFQNNPRKLGYAYILTPEGMAQKMALTGRFLQRKLQEYEAIKREIEVLKAEIGDTETCNP